MTIDEDKRFRALLALVDAYNHQVRHLGSDSEVTKDTRATIEEFVGWKQPKAVSEAKKP